jgi:hypothetical protein
MFVEQIQVHACTTFSWFLFLEPNLWIGFFRQMSDNFFCLQCLDEFFWPLLKDEAFRPKLLLGVAQRLRIRLWNERSWIEPCQGAKILGNK